MATVYEPLPRTPDEWACEFSIIGLSEPIHEVGRGIDSLQALLVSLDGVRMYLTRSAEALIWAEGEPGDHGVPSFINSGFGLQIDRHLEKLVSDEIARLVEEKRAMRTPPSTPEGG